MCDLTDFFEVLTVMVKRRQGINGVFVTGIAGDADCFKTGQHFDVLLAVAQHTDGE